MAKICESIGSRAGWLFWLKAAISCYKLRLDYRITRSQCTPGVAMKILAVHPSCLMYSKIFLRLEPLGIELIAAAARRAGHDVRLIDLQVEPARELSSELLDEWQPDAIALSCNYLANVPEVIDLAKLAAARLPASVCLCRRPQRIVHRPRLARARRGRDRLRAQRRRRSLGRCRCSKRSISGDRASPARGARA